MANIPMRELPEEIELYRDRKWRREESLKVDSAEAVEAMVEDLGFCLGLTDVRKMMPSVYIAVCGRRDAHMPRNVQKDLEASRAWVLKDEVMARGRVYYAKLIKGKSWFLAQRMIPVFNAIWGCIKTARIRRAFTKEATGGTQGASQGMGDGDGRSKKRMRI